MNKQRNLPLLPSIQVLRFIAATGVMLSHVGFGSFYINNINFSAGVNLFYCISAFLMMYTSQTKPEVFVRKRLIRIIPLYWILTILTFISSKIVSGLSEANIDPASLIKSMLFIPYSRDGINTSDVIRPIVGPAWTLTYDIMFLLVFALSMKINHKYRGMISAFICALILFTGKILPDDLVISRILGRDFWLNFIFGIIIFYIYKYTENKIDFKDKTKVLWLALSLLGLLMLYIGKKSLWEYSVFSFVILTSVLLSFGNKEMPRFFIWFGNISYSFYLTHYYVIIIIGFFIDFSVLNILTVAGTVLAFLISLAVAYLSYILIEVRLGNILKTLLIKKK